MKKVLVISLASLLCAACTTQSSQTDDSDVSRPFGDATHAMVPQLIPGKVMCAYYDLGGESVAYHDMDEQNNGSGGLNPADGSYLNEFRINEGVDISYIKKDIDYTENNTFIPEMNMLYLGWTDPEEWVKYTVSVTESGTYSLNVLYTAAEDAMFSIAVNEQESIINLPSTGYYHHWAKAENVATVELEEGIQVLMLTTLKSGPTNYAYLEFILKK